MNCQEALSLLYDIIDKEASEVDSQEVRKHIDRCNHCSEIYRVEREVNEFLRAKLSTDKPVQAQAKLKDKITRLLDDADARGATPFPEGRDGGGRSSRQTILRAARYFAAAAALVVMIWGAFAVSDLVEHTAIYYDLERAHFAANNSSLEFATSDETIATLVSFTETHGCPISNVAGECALLGARTVEIGGNEFAHLLYRAADTTISVFAVPADRFEIPRARDKHKVAHGDRVVYDHHCRGCRLVYQKIGDLIFIYATDQHGFDLIKFDPTRGTV